MRAQMLRGFRRSPGADGRGGLKEPMAAARPHPRTKCFAREESPELLMSDSYGLKEFEIERRLRRQRDVAIAGQARATGTRSGADQRTNGSTFAATGNCPDGRATSCATAHHDCGTLAFSFTGHP